MDWIDISGIITICIGTFVFIPILLYYCYQFNALPASSNIVKHRTKSLIYSMNILSILSLIFERPFVIIINVFDPNNAIHEILRFPSWTTYITDSLVIWSVFVLFTIKSWILFYNFQFQLSLTRLVWKKEINPRYRSWFIMNKNKYGNPNYCICIVIIPFLLYIGLETYVEGILLNENYNVFAHSMAIFSLICIIPSFILYHKLRTFDDIFGIKKEIFYQQIIIIILISILLFGFIFEMIIKSVINYNNNIDIIRIEWLFNTMIASIVLFLISFISIWYPVRLEHVEMSRNLHNLHDINRKQLQIPSISTKHGSSPSSQSVVTSISKGIKCMIQILSDKKGFNGFMKHLVSEFATESLFFLMEYIQIKYEEQIKHNGIIKIAKPKYLDENLKNILNLNESDDEITINFNIENNYHDLPMFNKTDSIHSQQTMSYLFNNDGSISSIILLPAGLPKSEIINKYKTFNKRLYALYLKYIKPGAIHEINISYIQRQEIEQIFDSFEQNKEEMNLFNIMDEACNEILSLMVPSFNRFISNDNIENKIPNIHRITSKENEECDNNQQIQLTLRNGASYSRMRDQYETV